MSFQMLRRKSLIGGLLALLLLFGGPANAGSEEGANAFLRSLADQAARSLTDADIPRPERMKRFKLRFTGVSYPGMDVRTQVWEMPDQSVRFRVVDANNPETILLNFALAEWQ